MNTRLKQFLAAENISQSQFADTIRVVRASVSHVLSGRNNPSYEFIKAIMNCYPNLNMEWLMLGKGKMYKEQSESLPKAQTPAPLPESDLLFGDYYDDMEITPPEEEKVVPFPEQEVKNQPTTNINTLNNTIQTIVKQRNVSKILILFDDGTFQEM